MDTTDPPAGRREMILGAILLGLVVGRSSRGESSQLMGSALASTATEPSLETLVTVVLNQVPSGPRRSTSWPLATIIIIGSAWEADPAAAIGTGPIRGARTIARSVGAAARTGCRIENPLL